MVLEQRKNRQILLDATSKNQLERVIQGETRYNTLFFVLTILFFFSFHRCCKINKHVSLLYAIIYRMYVTYYYTIIVRKAKP